MDNDDFNNFLKQLGIDTSTLSKKPNPTIKTVSKIPPPGISPDWWDEQMKVADQRTIQESRVKENAIANKQKTDIEILRRKLETISQRAKQNKFNSLPRNYVPLKDAKSHISLMPSIVEVFTKFAIKHRDNILVGLTLIAVLSIAMYCLS